MSFILYNFLLWIFSPFLLLFLIYRTWKRKDSLVGIYERFGFHDFESKTSRRKKIWIHAVSVGEVKIAETVIRNISSKNPELTIYLSTITETGRFEALKIPDVQKVFYLPFDFVSIVKRILRAMSPDILVVIETEIWPNLINQARIYGCPVFIVNARLSRRSFNRYKLFRFFFRPTFKLLSKVVARGSEDADYFKYLGAHNVIVSGDIKYDSIDFIYECEKNYTDFFKSKSFLLQDLIIAGSTHEGEEEIILSAFISLQRFFPKISLMIAPRHIDRVETIEKKIQRMGQNSILWSSIKENNLENGKIIILDVMGELAKLYSCAIFAFVGGSLVRHGGQNPIEVAVSRIPVIFGPYMYNFSQVSDSLLEKGAAFQVKGEEDLKSVMNKLLSDEDLRLRMGSMAYELIKEKQGSSLNVTEMILKEIESYEV